MTEIRLNHIGYCRYHRTGGNVGVTYSVIQDNTCSGINPAENEKVYLEFDVLRLVERVRSLEQSLCDIREGKDNPNEIIDRALKG